jgi:hypothetical protein
VQSLALITALALAAGACNPDGEPENLAPATGYTVTDLDPTGLAWIDEDRLIVTHSPDGNAITRLAILSLPDRAVEDVPDPPEVGCFRVAVGPPVYRDGSAYFVLTCIYEFSLAKRDSFDLFRFDLADESYTKIGTIGEVGGGPGNVALSPDGTRAIIGSGSLCGVLVEAGPIGARPIKVEVIDGDDHFNLDDFRDRGGECGHRGWARYPAWSPDGATIAFFAAPAAAGTVGPERGPAPANLYFLPVDGAAAWIALSGLREPRALNYSPDGAALAFSAKVNGVDGVWTMNIESGEIERVLDRRAPWLSWSPDGDQIAVLLEVGPNLDETDLVLVDIDPIVEP